MQPHPELVFGFSNFTAPVGEKAMGHAFYEDMELKETQSAPPKAP